MSTVRLVDQDEFPARVALKDAQKRLEATLVAAEAASDALARGREHLGVIEGQRDEARAEVVEEARDLAETFTENGVVAVVGGSSRREREIRDELEAFRIAFDILVQKNATAQRAIGECEAAVAAAVKDVIAEETEPLLCRMRDNENAAAMLRSKLRALQYCGQFGLCPGTLPRQLAQEPANVHRADRPLNFNQQKVFDRQKAAWQDLADALREDAGAKLSLGD